jgi:gliding motility-associated-like protein
MDGLNDYFWPLNAYKAENIVFTVFNRKGIKVFETKQWPGKWDGTYKGEPQDPGTYVWLFQYRDAMGKKQLQKGTVLLLK